MCEHCDGRLHPNQLISVYKGCGIVRMMVLNKSRQEAFYIDNYINYCPMCGRRLQEDK